MLVVVEVQYERNQRIQRHPSEGNSLHQRDQKFQPDEVDEEGGPQNITRHRSPGTCDLKRGAM